MRAVQSCQFRQPTLRVLRDRSPTNVAVVAWQRLIGWSQFDLPDVHPAGLLVDSFGLTPKSRTAPGLGALLTGCSACSFYDFVVCNDDLTGILVKPVCSWKARVLCYRLQSSSASRFTAGCCGFLLLIQC